MLNLQGPKIASASIARAVKTNEDMYISFNENEAIEVNASIDLTAKYGKKIKCIIRCRLYSEELLLPYFWYNRAKKYKIFKIYLIISSL